MSSSRREFEPLLGGYLVARAGTEAIGALGSHTFKLPGFSAPMTRTGGQRYAPAPGLSMWAGIRPGAPFDRALTTASIVNVAVDWLIEPYDANLDLPGAARPANLQPLMVPLGIAGVRQASGVGSDNVLGYCELSPWPPGAVAIRISYVQSVGPNALGPVIDFCCAWNAIAQPVFLFPPLDRDALGG